MPIELFTWQLFNGRKISVALEEMGPVSTPVKIVDITKGQQHDPAFLEDRRPNNKIPAIIDPDGPDGAPIMRVQSPALILIYLGEKTRTILA